MTAALPEWNDALKPVQPSAKPVENVVLPLDGNVLSRPAISVARGLSELYDATLHVTYVGERTLDLKDAPGFLGLQGEEMRSAVFEQIQGDPVQAVIHLTRKLPQALIVTSTHTGRQTNIDSFASFAESIYQSKPERIVMLAPERGEEPWNLHRILLAHDGTPACQSATGPAADLAQRAGAEVVALHVAARGKKRPSKPGSFTAPQYLDQVQHEWPTWTEEFANRILATGAPTSRVRFQLVVTAGQPGSEVAQVARERKSDLVIMAWHGHRDRKTCATRVAIRNCGCPVLLVYSPGE